MTVMGTTVMVPVHTWSSAESPYVAEPVDGGSQALLYRDDERVGVLSFPPQPRFYGLQTEDGIPYWKIAQLHARDVLATTVLQTCFRYGELETRCQFCAIGESLKGGRTIAQKTPQQLTEVAEAAMRLDGVTHMVMTTGTPPTPDRGASVLAEAARAVSGENGSSHSGPSASRPTISAGFRSFGMRASTLSGCTSRRSNPAVRARIMPGKAEVPVSFYMEAYRAAVAVFGRGQVSTYLLAGSEIPDRPFWRAAVASSRSACTPSSSLSSPSRGPGSSTRALRPPSSCSRCCSLWAPCFVKLA